MDSDEPLKGADGIIKGTARGIAWRRVCRWCSDQFIFRADSLSKKGLVHSVLEHMKVDFHMTQCRIKAAVKGTKPIDWEGGKDEHWG